MISLFEAMFDGCERHVVYVGIYLHMPFRFMVGQSCTDFLTNNTKQEKQCWWARSS